MPRVAVRAAVGWGRSCLVVLQSQKLAIHPRNGVDCDPCNTLNLRYRHNNLDLFGMINYWTWDSPNDLRIMQSTFLAELSGKAERLQADEGIRNYRIGDPVAGEGRHRRRHALDDGDGSFASLCHLLFASSFRQAIPF